MQSSNPVFTRAEGFNGRSDAQDTPAYPGSPDPTPTPSQWGTGAPGGQVTRAQVDQGRMTIDSRGAEDRPDPRRRGASSPRRTWSSPATSPTDAAMGSLYALSMVGALGGFALAMVNSFKRVISPALVLAYAAFEGVFVGAFSKVIESIFTQRREPGRPGHRRRARHDGGRGRHPGGVQVLQHQGRARGSGSG